MCSAQRQQLSRAPPGDPGNLFPPSVWVLIMPTLAHIADRVLNRPLLIMPEKLAVITEVLAGRIGIDASAVAGLLPEASRFEGDLAFETVGGGKQALPYRRNADGTAIISVIGSLVNRGAWVGASSGLVSYEGLTFQVEKAAKDPETKAIVLDMQSPGGEAVGAFECASAVRAAAKVKPVIAVVNGMACSAAYAIASACRSIVSIDTGISGSIGVVMMHADYSRAIDKAGITPTFIHAGAHKVDGNPYQPLSAGVKTDMQAEVDAFYAKFLETVAAGRGNRLTAKAARATEARCLIGQDAKAAGLVDEIGTFADVISSLSPAAKGRALTRRLTMFTQDDLDRARAEGKTSGFAEGKDAGAAAGKAEGFDDGKKAGVDQGRLEGATAERARIKTIIESDAAKGREASAMHLALNTDMSAEAAAGVLQGLAKSSSIEQRAAGAVLGNTASVDTGERETAAPKIDRRAIFGRISGPQ